MSKSGIKYWLMSDFHLGHDKITLPEYGGRPKNYEIKIFDGLKTICEKDCLIFLGDYCIGNDNYWHESHIMKFDFKKILVRGNHDRKSYSWYLDHGWDWVCDHFGMKIYGLDIHFSHMPVRDFGNYDLNIHGHFHNTHHRDHEPELVAIKNDKQLLIKLEHHYQPMLLQKIVGNYNKDLEE